MIFNEIETKCYLQHMVIIINEILNYLTGKTMIETPTERNLYEDTD